MPKNNFYVLRFLADGLSCDLSCDACDSAVYALMLQQIKSFNSHVSLQCF